MPIPADDDMAAEPPNDIKAIIAKAVESAGSDDDIAEAIISALREGGFAVQSMGPEEPLMGGGEDDVDPNRPERNPPAVGDGGDVAAKGEPMSIDQIGADLFDQYMKPGSAPAT
jgi:hypothetical protein